MGTILRVAHRKMENAAASRSLRQAAKASALHADIPGFESLREHHASLAQLAERGRDMAEAAGSYPARRTINAPVAQWQSNRLISDRCWSDSRLVHHRNGDQHDHIAQIGAACRRYPPLDGCEA